MVHSEGLSFMNIILAYVKPQREVDTTDVLLFSCWHSLAAKKMKEAQKQIPITDF
jgi:hypothetical protein